MESLRVLLADDHEIVREGVRALIQGQSGRESVAKVSDGRDAVAKANLTNPHIAILDTMMTWMSHGRGACAVSGSEPDHRSLIPGSSFGTPGSCGKRTDALPLASSRYAKDRDPRGENSGMALAKVSTIGTGDPIHVGIIGPG
jgi:CheY-like chemotaxis protein